jgi:TfoX/Sxy family transcriptional regulator of competence genes
MAFDEHLAERVRELLGAERRVTEQRMFGGLAFLVDGKMAVTVSRAGGLMVRVDPAHTDELLRRPHTAPMVMRGRELDGWIRVDADGVRTKRQLQLWVVRGVEFARSLPAKS